MRAQLIKRKGYGKGMTCMHCRRVLKPGEVALCQSIDYQKTWWHKSCIEKVIANAPKEEHEYLSAFEDLKEQVAQGKDIL